MLYAATCLCLCLLVNVWRCLGVFVDICVCVCVCKRASVSAAPSLLSSLCSLSIRQQAGPWGAIV